MLRLTPFNTILRAGISQHVGPFQVQPLICAYFDANTSTTCLAMQFLVSFNYSE